MNNIPLKEYYASPHWKKLSKNLLEDKECECALCGKKRWMWQKRNKKWKRVYRFAVHHLDYSHLNEEEKFPSCLMTLCYTCHETAHLMFRMRNSSKLFLELSDIFVKYGFKYDKGATS